MTTEHDVVALVRAAATAAIDAGAASVRLDGPGTVLLTPERDDAWPLWVEIQAADDWAFGFGEAPGLRLGRDVDEAERHATVAAAVEATVAGRVEHTIAEHHKRTVFGNRRPMTHYEIASYCPVDADPFSVQHFRAYGSLAALPPGRHRPAPYLPRDRTASWEPTGSDEALRVSLTAGTAELNARDTTEPSALRTALLDLGATPLEATDLTWEIWPTLPRAEKARGRWS